jgi:hypothetical protein
VCQREPADVVAVADVSLPAALYPAERVASAFYIPAKRSLKSLREEEAKAVRIVYM